MTEDSGWKLPAIIPDGQVKLGGMNVAVGFTGTNLLSESATLESRNFAAGSAGFRLAGDGEAEFNAITVRGTIIGALKTAAAGQRLEILPAEPSLMALYSGNVAETDNADLGLADQSTYPQLVLRNAAYGGFAQKIDMTDPSPGRRSITIEGGKPGAGTRGWIYLQPSSSPEGRVMLRDTGLAGIKNLGTTVSAGSLAGAMSDTESTPCPAFIAETRAITFVGGNGSFTLPAGGFPNGLLMAVANYAASGGGASAIIHINNVASTKTVLHLYGELNGGVALNAAYQISYLALGW